MNIDLAQFWRWVKSNFTTSYQQEIKDYLSQATDHADLEYRMRVLAYRGML